MAQPIWNESKKSYLAQEKTNPKDRIEVEVGDAQDSSDFFPQIKIKRWDNEVNASLRLVHANIPGNVTYSDDGEKITWIKRQGQNEWKAVFYHRDDLDEGGYEFEIHLPANPPQNYLEFTVNTKELDWFYQPALTQEEIDEGAVQPDNVIGSYAVYHKTKGGINNADGMEYKVGKAFHVYRPHVVDNNGNETWGTLELNETTGILRISVDQTWLNSAVYPVVVDPTFGYTSIGVQNNVIANVTSDTSTMSGSSFPLQYGGTLTSISAALRDSSGAEVCDVFLALYREDSAGAGSHGLVASVEQENVSNDATATFYTIDSTSEALAVDTYILAALGNGEDRTGSAFYVMADLTGVTTTRNTYSESTTGAGSYATRKSENPWTETATSEKKIFSIYATFTSHSLIHAESETDAGFTAGHPFTSGEAKDYTTQITLDPDTYYWRVAAKDVSAGTVYGSWSSTRSFTITGGGGGTNFQLNIGDTWKTVTAIQINIGDTWKAVTHAQINIGDTWKTIFSLLLSLIPFWRHHG